MELSAERPRPRHARTPRARCARTPRATPAGTLRARPTRAPRTRRARHAHTPDARHRGAAWTLVAALAVAASGPALAAPPPAESPAESSAVQVVDAFHAAIAGGDRAGALALLDPQVVWQPEACRLAARSLILGDTDATT